MNLLGPCIANDVEAIHAGFKKSARKIPDLVLLALFRDIFDRRLAVDPAQQQRRQKSCSQGLHLRTRLPGHASEICLGQAIEQPEKAARALWPPLAFQQQVIEAE